MNDITPAGLLPCLRSRGLLRWFSVTLLLMGILGGASAVRGEEQAEKEQQEEVAAEEAVAEEAVTEEAVTEEPEEAVAEEADEAEAEEAVAEEAVAEEAVAEEAAKGWPLRWVLGLAATEQEDRMVAATAEGLLLREGVVVAFDPQSPEAVRELYRQEASIWGLAVRGNRVASSDYRGNLALYDLEEESLTEHPGALERWTRSLAFSSDGSLLAAVNEAGKAFVWSIEKSEAVAARELEGGQGTAVALAPSEESVAVATGGQIHLLKWPDLEPIRTLEVGEALVLGLAFSPSGERLFAGLADNRLVRLAVDGQSEAEEVGRASDWISAVVADPSSGPLVATSLDGSVMVIEQPDGEVTLEQVGQASSGLWSAAFGAQGRLVVGTRRDTVTVFRRGWQTEYVAESQEDR